MRLVIVTLIFSIVLIVYMMGAPAPISLSVSPAIQFAPGHITLTIRIPRSDDNREYCFGYGDNDQLSCRQLNGSNAPQLIQEHFSRILPGEYEAWAELSQTLDRKHKSIAKFNVITQTPH